jgi:hypothetical protein
MFVDGRKQEHATPLGENLQSVSVKLRRAGFGISVRDDIEVPRVWLAGANGFARYEADSGSLEVVERIAVLALKSGEQHQKRQVWLDLPSCYRDNCTVPYVDIEAYGKLTARDFGVETIIANTQGAWGEVTVSGLHVARSGFFKARYGNVVTTGTIAPQDTDPMTNPSLELIAMSGEVWVSDSKASWRIYGDEVIAPELIGPSRVTTI